MLAEPLVSCAYWGYDKHQFEKKLHCTEATPVLKKVG